MRIVTSPYREYALIAFVSLALGIDFIDKRFGYFLWVAAFLGSLHTVWNAGKSIKNRKVTIDTFNALALAISFVANEIRSAAFIVLMLLFADVLEWKTKSRAHHAVEELLTLRPERILREVKEHISEIPIEAVKAGDILIVKSGSRVPVDGVILSGDAFVNESLVTGESLPIKKLPGDRVLASTLNESGVIRMKATRVGKDSTIERMAELIREAARNKSRSERLADRFAEIFLPFVLVVGVITYIVTRDLTMTAAVFLVACADDMAVAIPLAVTASLGKAAKRGVVVKGGEYLDMLGKVDTLILDKTGTLTYGKFSVKEVSRELSFSENHFWRAVAVAEKFSEHPVGRAIFVEATQKIGEVPDPVEFRLYEGSGILARYDSDEIIIGDESILNDLKVALDSGIRDKYLARQNAHTETTVLVLVNRKFAGMITVADIPKPSAKESILALKNLGIKNIVMFTGDSEQAASSIAHALGIESYKASMKPEDKLREIELITKSNIVAMVGDGINDAPALARADVGIAMGRGETAIAVEAADTVMLVDDLSRIPEMVLLGRKTQSVIRLDMLIWIVSNAFGFYLVLGGFIGPAFAAFYNFATDFFPLLNSARLFRYKTKY